MDSQTTPAFITEDYLRQHVGLRAGGEIYLPAGTRFTPSAQQMITERQITVKWRDESGRVFIGEQDEAKASTKQVHPLKTNNARPKNACVMCGSDIADKPALMTHLNDQVLVPKTHPRIALRGKLDSCICFCVMAQCAMENQPEILRGFMADIRSYLGQLLQAEVTEQPLPLPSLGDFQADEVHRWSHKPLAYLGHDHLLPEVSYGQQVAQLNYLRALVRELELMASQVYLDDCMQLSRNDIVAGLNRLSSAVYVVMILVLQCEKGRRDILKELGHEVA
ncbi:ethanolamine utilization cob(I)yrinic acid a,c-diamide adenosyltransferase EutT [Photobacterium sp. DA100]|uniref:ethanolamine utilization cob(I)yrinic acid a,c-diamide adenosyltransferase EutT n=1 Tax=Photobacterium sp. DA100 TaxID=3027472 RepID=UPI00247B2825|nr:ethanolamine utilization cob(I)yrinic acid a,c-diamide adenosyltransferase EutT [Photobacterium sp. DA100]WEM41080.1 ethanolamine utilization cob(I)yrinic acid a,c-diamide adenosyltransferase EutT [Photobacterium sp. DA100]